MALLRLTIAPAALSGGEVYYAEATKQLSAGINFVPRSAYRFVKQSATLTAGKLALTAEYVALFGSLVVGQKIFIRLSTINSSGFRSVPVESSIVVS